VVKAVSLHLFVQATGGIFAVCQVRGRYNFEPPELEPFGRLESWSGGLQPAVHGKMEEFDQNDTVHCILRESGEEFGVEFANGLREMLALTEIGVKNNVMHYRAVVTPEVFNDIHLHPSTGGLRLLSQSDLPSVQNLKTFSKQDVIPHNVNAMFADDLESMMEAWPKD
jgi:hypothetical protein